MVDDLSTIDEIQRKVLRKRHTQLKSAMKGLYYRVLRQEFLQEILGTFYFDEDGAVKSEIEEKVLDTI